MNSSDTSTTYTLSTLLPSTSYLLAYSLPLFLISSTLTFAGCFLTFDRTRSFPPRYDVIPGSFDQPKRKTKFTWMLEGGLGGLASGYVFGVHLSTCLSLLIPSVTSSIKLSRSSFLAVWILSCLPTTALAGRWKYFALAFSGISGGALFSLGLAVIIHPARLTRLVLLAIATPLVLILVLLPLERTQRHALRFANAATGAFGLTMTTAIMAHVPAWANVWERLWQTENIAWGTRNEKGLSAMFCILLCIGIVTDWLLKRTFGECPDQKWDAYLANFTANFPSQANRAGSFQPLTSFWDKLFHPSKQPPRMPADILFPSDKGATSETQVSLPHSHKNEDSDTAGGFDLPKPKGGFLKKKKSSAGFKVHNVGRRKMREAVKFRPNLSDSDSDNDGFATSPLSATSPRPWLSHKASIASSDATLLDEAARSLSPVVTEGAKCHVPRATRSGKADIKIDEVDYDKEVEKLKTAGKVRGLRKGEAPEYSDFEDGDLGIVGRPATKDRGKDWSPGFLERHRSGAASSSASHRVSGASTTSGTNTAVPPPLRAPLPAMANTLAVPLGAVPATPSLIHALDRIALAHKDAFTPPQHSKPPPEPVAGRQGHVEGLPLPKSQARWQNFWREVEEKAKAPP